MKLALKLGLALTAVAILVPAIVVTASRARYVGRLRFPYLGTKLSPEAYQALAQRPGWKAVALEVAPQVKLRGLVRRPSKSIAPWVLFYPGNDATQLSRGQNFLTAVAAEHDFGLAVFAYRGYDASDGESRYEDLAADAARLLSELCRTEQVDSSKVHVVGFSIGGHFATIAAGQSLSQSRAVRSLSLLASVNDIVMERPAKFGLFIDGDDYQTRPLLGPVRGPVLVLQGTADEALKGPGQARDIARELGTRATLIEFEGVGHQALLTHTPAISKLTNFIEQHSEPHSEQ